MDALIYQEFCNVFWKNSDKMSTHTPCIRAPNDAKYWKWLNHGCDFSTKWKHSLCCIKQLKKTNTCFTLIERVIYMKTSICLSTNQELLQFLIKSEKPSFSLFKKLYLDAENIAWQRNFVRKSIHNECVYLDKWPSCVHPTKINVEKKTKFQVLKWLLNFIIYDWLVDE